METKSSPVTPVTISSNDKHHVNIIWNDGHESEYPARNLRLACPCATCRDEMTGAPLIKSETIPEDIHLLDVKLVGRYAISIRWSDNHDTGIYTFEHLRKLG